MMLNGGPVSHPSVNTATTIEHRATLLVVEDNRDTAELLRALLEDDYAITLAHSYDEALREAQGHAYDLFLFDINLGSGKTGSDLLHALRTQPEHAGTPAVACTAYALQGGTLGFSASGFDAYLRKPFEIDELMRTVDALLPH